MLQGSLQAVLQAQKRGNHNLPTQITLQSVTSPVPSTCVLNYSQTLGLDVAARSCFTDSGSSESLQMHFQRTSFQRGRARMVFDRNQKDGQSLKLFPSSTAAAWRSNCMMEHGVLRFEDAQLGKRCPKCGGAQSGEGTEKPASSG